MFRRHFSTRNDRPNNLSKFSTFILHHHVYRESKVITNTTLNIDGALKYFINNETRKKQLVYV